MLSQFQDEEWDLDDIQIDSFEDPSFNHEPFSVSDMYITKPLTLKQSNLTNPFNSNSFKDVPASPLPNCYTPSFKYLSSPISSSNASLVASEGEEEDFDDIVFPEQINISTLRKFNSQNSLFEDDNDFSLGLILPDELNPPTLKEEFQQVSTPNIEHVVFQQKENGRPLTRPAKILNYLKPTAASQNRNQHIIKNKQTLMKPSKNSTAFGDGTELDMFDDLPVSFATENKFKKTPKTSSRLETKTHTPSSRSLKPSKSPSIQSPKMHNSQRNDDIRTKLSRSLGPQAPRRAQDLSIVSKPPIIPTHVAPLKKKQKKKPTLIRNLNAPDVKVVGAMKYNPQLQKWEGNDDCLLEFDRIMNSKPLSKPALITDLSQCTQLNGNMTFDPIKMCWVGNEDETDLFSDCFEESLDISKPQEIKIGNEFILSTKLKESLYIAESNHKIFIGKWFPKILESRTLIRETSKAHLYEIRAIYC